MNKLEFFFKKLGEGQVRLRLPMWLSLLIVAPALSIFLFLDVFSVVDKFPQEQSYYFVRDVEDVLSDNPSQVNTEYNLSYNLNNDESIDIVHKTELDIITLEDNSLKGIILGDMKSLIVIILLFFIYVEMTYIVQSLYISLNDKVWFSMDNYKSFMNIVKYLIAILITLACFSIAYLFMVDDVFVNGTKVFLIPGVWYATIIASAVIIRLIAYVYKKGIELHEEQMLTI